MSIKTEKLAFIYAIPIGDEMVKFGSHTGPLQSLINRYKTTTSLHLIRQGFAYQIESQVLLSIEMNIATMLKRYPEYWIEGEKYRISAIPVYEICANFHALPNTKTWLRDINNTKDQGTQTELVLVHKHHEDHDLSLQVEEEKDPNKRLAALRTQKEEEKEELERHLAEIRIQRKKEKQLDRQLAELRIQKKKEKLRISTESFCREIVLETVNKSIISSDREEDDPYQQFVDDTFEVADGADMRNRLRKSEVHQKAQLYLRQNFPDIRFKSKVAEKTFERIFGPVTGTRIKDENGDSNTRAYKGIRYKTVTVEDE